MDIAGSSEDLLPDETSPFNALPSLMPTTASVVSALFQLSTSTQTPTFEYSTPTTTMATVSDMLNGTNSTNATSVPRCKYEEPPLTALRFWVVTVFGTTIALCSIVENMFFSYLFSTRKHHRTTFNMYMMFISLFDIFISISYILIQSMNVLMDFMQSLTLFRIWHIYMVPFLTISHCAITAGSFLILAATIERYLLTANSKYVRWVQRNRRYIIMFAILMGILSKVTICLEFKISYNEECANTMNEIDINFADFVFATDYHLYWRFYYRNFVTIFFPFFALLVLNAKIISVLAKYEKENYKFQMLQSATATAKQMKRKKVTRAATVTTILVVCSYLVSNIISVALTTWEHIDKPSLVGEYIQIYFISIDLSSLLTVCSCAFRPLIYLICQPGLRNEVFYLLKGMCRVNDEVGDPQSHFTKSVFEPMYNSNELSSYMQPSPATPVAGGGDLSSLLKASYPQVPRKMMEINNNEPEKEALLQQSNNICCNGRIHEGRASLAVLDSRTRHKLQPAAQHRVQDGSCTPNGYRRRLSDCSNGSVSATASISSSELLRNILAAIGGDETHL